MNKQGSGLLRFPPGQAVGGGGAGVGGERGESWSEMSPSAGARIWRVTPLKSWCFISSSGTEAQSGEGASWCHTAREWGGQDCKLACPVNFLWLLLLGSAVSESPAQAGHALDRLAPGQSYPFSNLEWPCGPDPWRCSTLNLTLSWALYASCVRMLVTQCPNPAIT